MSETNPISNRSAVLAAARLAAVLSCSPAQAPAAPELVPSGAVELRHSVSPEGKAVDVVVVKSEPPGHFDERALSALRSKKFTPRQRNGKPVVTKGVITRMAFKLRNLSK